MIILSDGQLGATEESVERRDALVKIPVTEGSLMECWSWRIQMG
jgi:hypothetical protein